MDPGPPVSSRPIRRGAGRGARRGRAAGPQQAVDRRFHGQASAEDIITYVADVRARAEPAGEDMDPETAARLIGKVLGRGSVGGVDSMAAFTARQYPLVALVVDAGYDDAGLDEFVGKHASWPTSGSPELTRTLLPGYWTRCAGRGRMTRQPRS